MRYTLNAVKIILGLFVYISLISALNSSEAASYRQTQASFKFKDGIFITIEMVRNNRPMPPTWIETDIEIDDPYFYEKITRADVLRFYDENGVSRWINIEDIWGYGLNSILYVNIGSKFHKINFIGRVSHFVASATTGSPPVIRKERYINGPIYEYKHERLTVKHKEYLIDFENNSYWEFDIYGLEKVLADDPRLLNEFDSLSKRKQNKMKYNYLIRFNEKHPFDRTGAEEAQQDIPIKEICTIFTIK